MNAPKGDSLPRRNRYVRSQNVHTKHCLHLDVDVTICTCWMDLESIGWGPHRRPTIHSPHYADCTKPDEEHTWCPRLLTPPNGRSDRG